MITIFLSQDLIKPNQLEYINVPTCHLNDRQLDEYSKRVLNVEGLLERALLAHFFEK